MKLPQKIAFVDIETTGGRLFYDRIIEIGIVIYENGKITKKFNSLIDPQKYLPPEITNLTGIKESDLEGAPTFRQIYEDIHDLLKDTIFVAHNVRFDLGFLKAEYKRLDKPFSPKHFCTVKLSRALFPQFKHHNLDSLIERFNFICLNRHRALDDALVICEFYQMAQKQFGEEVLIAALNNALKKPSRPISLKPEVLDNLPQTPGVYIFYGANSLPLYIGKSINIRERVLSHFNSDHSSTTEMKISQQVESIETIQTAGELGALIKEAQMIKELQPLYNRKLRRLNKLNILRRVTTDKGYKSVVLETITSIDISILEDIVGIFKTQKSAKDFLINAAKENSLCEKLLGVEKTKTGCFGYRLGRCRGACIDKENPTMYNLRFALALSHHQIKPWPFRGPVLIEEKDPFQEIKEQFIIDKWCLLDHPFDLDTYKILTSYLKSSSNLKTVKQIPPESLQQFID